MPFSKSPTIVPSHSTCMHETQGDPLSAREGTLVIVIVGEVLSCDHQVLELLSSTQDEEFGVSADPCWINDASLSFSTV